MLRLDRHQQPLTMPRGVPVEHVDQGVKRCGRILDAVVVARGSGMDGDEAEAGAATMARIRSWGVSASRKGSGFERHAQFAFDARQELGARKAVQPIVAFERVVEA